MEKEPDLHEVQKEWHGSYRSYGIGFFLSTILTLLSFLMVAIQPISKGMIPFFLMGLAALQAAIQLRFFLHLGEEPKPKWESLLFSFAIVILLTVVVGSLWIINDLHHRAMPNM